MVFLNDRYQKPRLIETKIIKKILANEQKKVSFEQIVFDKIYNFLYNNYHIILIIIFISVTLYWRFLEIKNRKKKYRLKQKKFFNENYNQNNEYSEYSEDSNYSTYSEDSS